ncbi:ABC transporter permease [Candidatus Poribacteria bacterium]|nr:ABC transporter permease [Candidatus Poribacteria bacterium]
MMYLPERFLQEAAGQQGAYNQIIGWVHDSSQGKLDATLKALARRLDAYGVFDTLRADEQPSVKFLADELRGLRVTSKLFPLIFLGVAVLVLNIMMERLVTQQRAVIGTLQAVGYTRGEITRHYMGYGVVIGTLGGVAGMGWGYYVQGFMIGLYRQFYALPSIDRHFHADLNAAGLLLSIVCAVAGTVHGVRVASRLQPAEAMSPPPPERGGRVFLERMPPVWNLLTFRGKMIARAILRNPFRTSVAILASAVAAALTVASLNMLSSLHYMTRHEFEATSHQDVTIATRDPEGAPALREIALLPGIAGTEGNLAVACELTNGAVTKRVAITGLPPDGRLVTPLDNSGRPIRIPPSGLVLSKRLAQRLGVRPGDLVRVRTLIARRTERTVAVAGVADTYLGLSAYADIEYLSRLIGEEHGANVIQASYIPDGRHGRFLEELRRRPSVMGMSERLRSLELVDKVFGENMGTMLGLMIFFSGMIAFGAVLNTALVSVSERQREIGTLRVLGYSPAQVWGIFSGESLTLNGLGVLLGLAGGIGLTHLLALAYNTDLYRFPVVIPARNLLIAAALMVGFAGLAQLVIYRLVLRLPWLEVLKVRE